ncbi:cobalamin B12-binding domain-containing protein [Calorimonas adulescens]|jgi:B12 binding domain.|uniref:Cobalamin B12-binding domain-containing protein n=1 Tax=Calorimonas adulescens TaxID=2606906 RepID=A0A5D8QBR4_9THEO|nr:cobalamin B12-binding domain-containing protein [Calorimonas adulescens]TZE81589.1 cobalamin B12-binding domain-containing protein [Calorimonas adulescens]
MKRLIIAAALGNDVHVAGIMNFLKLAEEQGYDTMFMGPAVAPERIIEAAIEHSPYMVGISYRLTPSALKPLLDKIDSGIERYRLKDIKWVFGGTEPTADVARQYRIFEKIFDGSGDMDDTIMYLKGIEDNREKNEIYPQSLIGRIESKYPFPVIRHHFGLPDLGATIEGVRKIAESKVVDVISIAPDQNAQEHFFEPEKMDHDLDGAGGAPLRTAEDFKALYENSRTGNYPLLRCYSGTNNVFEMAKMLLDTIHNAWAAIPLCWYNRLDGRGPRDLVTSIAENQQLMRWHGERGVPVEVNEAHHWGLRDAHDAIYVAASYLAAYNAKKMGVRHYVAQYMFNLPPNESPRMDIAKMLAAIELVESLHDDDFITYRQARAGLASFPTDLYMAKGQLAASCYTAMAIKPHIYHVVGFCEAHHAATPEDVIESAKLVRGVVKNHMQGAPDVTADGEIMRRKDELVADALAIIDAVKAVGQGSKDPLADPIVIARAIKMGILDAPHLKGNSMANGTLATRLINGALYAYDEKDGRVLAERERLDRILNSTERVPA